MQSLLAIRNVSCGTFEESASLVRKMRSIFRTYPNANTEINPLRLKQFAKRQTQTYHYNKKAGAAGKVLNVGERNWWWDSVWKSQAICGIIG